MAWLKEVWYWLVAMGLLRELAEVKRDRDQQKLRYRNELESIRRENKKLKEFDERLKRENEALRAVDPSVKALDRVRHMASQQRIRDLEYEIIGLQRRLRECENRH